MKKALTEAVNDTATTAAKQASSTKPRRARRVALPRVATVRVALVRERGPAYPDPIRSAADVYRLLGPAARTWDRERFLTVILDAKNRVIGVDEVAVGTLSAALVHPRELFKAILLANAAAFVVCHGHPSGDCAPSAEDEALTRRLKSAAELMGIPLLDHVVLGNDQFYSFAEEGRL